MFLQEAMRSEIQPTSANDSGCPAIWIGRSSALNRNHAIIPLA
jgi:hypothetical protein